MTITMRSSTPHPVRMQRIVVRGATSGIALEIQRQLARQGRELLLVARSPQRLSELQSDLLARGAKQVLAVAADLARIQHHAGIYDFVRHSFPNFDTVLLAHGTMEDQEDSEASVDVLLDELNVNFVSAAALLTLFAADLEQRRTGCLAAITSVAGDRGRRSNYVYGSAKGALSLPPGASQPPSSRRCESHHHQAWTGPDFHDRPHGQLRPLRSPRACRARATSSTPWNTAPPTSSTLHGSGGPS